MFKIGDLYWRFWVTSYPLIQGKSSETLLEVHIMLLLRCYGVIIVLKLMYGVLGWYYTSSLAEFHLFGEVYFLVLLFEYLTAVICWFIIFFLFVYSGSSLTFSHLGWLHYWMVVVSWVAWFKGGWYFSCKTKRCKPSSLTWYLACPSTMGTRHGCNARARARAHTHKPCRIHLDCWNHGFHLAFSDLYPSLLVWCLMAS